VDKIFRKIDDKLHGNKKNSQAGRVLGDIKQKKFYTTKRMLSDLEKILKKLRYGLTKSLKNEVQYDYLQNMKYADHATLMEVARRIDYAY
jgi:hypothetical protein